VQSTNAISVTATASDLDFDFILKLPASGEPSECAQVASSLAAGYQRRDAPGNSPAILAQAAPRPRHRAGT